jgi:hypothetical protein
MSEIRRALNALQKMIAKAGIENVPLGNEKLRPLLMVMRDVAERHPTGDRRYIGQETGTGRRTVTMSTAASSDSIRSMNLDQVPAIAREQRFTACYC